MKKLKLLMFLAVVTVLAVFLYYQYTNNINKPKQEDETTKLSTFEKVMGLDLEKDYPISAREIVDYFNQIQLCYYNEEMSDSNIEKLAKRARLLFDEELLKENKYDDYLENLKLDIDDYKSKDKKITKIILDDASDIEYSEIDGVSYAKVECIYYLSMDSETDKVPEKYALRKGDDGKWKILGFTVLNPDEIN